MSVTKDMSIIKDIMIALEFKAIDYYKISGKWPFWYDDAMAWLREQYEQTSPVLSNSCKTGKDKKYDKPADKVEPKFKVGDMMRTLQEANDGYTDGMPVIVSIDNEYYHCTNELIAIKDQDDYEFPPINVKQKHNDKTKFKDGDWIIYRDEGCTEILRIIGVTDTHYLCNDISDDYCRNLNINFIDSHNYRLWTIQDAKQGDVLIDVYGNIGIYEKCDDFDWMSYCSLGHNGGFQHFKVEHDNEKTYPAIKKQRDQLEKAMHEAGYKWDAENKQLLSLKAEPTRKIKGNEEKIFLKLSKEDEEEFKIAIETLHEAGQHSSAMWLKSIKQRME